MSKPVPKPKPSIKKKPSNIKVFTANWAYSAQADDELNFEEGDIVYVSDQSQGDWWKGTCNGKTGMVPSNYLITNESGEGGEILFPLHEAAKRGNLEWVNECLVNKISINSQDKSGSTALYWASYGGHVEVVKVLLESKFIEINTQNKLGDTALIAASIKGRAEVVQALVKAGADTRLTNNAGEDAKLAANDPSGRYTSNILN